MLSGRVRPSRCMAPESVAVTDYGQQFAAIVEKDNVWAVQFHPEKSGDVGLKVLSNFLDLPGSRQPFEHRPSAA